MTEAQTDQKDQRDQTAPPPASPSGTPLQRAVRRVVRALGTDGVAPGDRAALRRSRPGDLGTPAFWRLAARLLEPE